MPKHRSARLDAFELQSSKWTIPVLLNLHSELLRYGALRERLGRISNKSLSAALRHLERDGLVGRRVFAQIPPRVDYWLTPLGDELVRVVVPFVRFAEQQQPAISNARREYDGRAHESSPMHSDRYREDKRTVPSLKATGRSLVCGASSKTAATYSDGRDSVELR